MVDLSINDILTLTRGDTYSMPLFLNKGTDNCPIRYVLQDTVLNGRVIGTDEIYVGIMEYNQPFECALVRKLYTKKNLNKYGDVIIDLKSNDTKCLHPGKYYYQIKSRFLKFIDDPTDYYGEALEYDELNNIWNPVNLPLDYKANKYYYEEVINTVIPKREFFISE